MACTRRRDSGHAENLVTEVYRKRTLSQIKLLPLLGEGSAPTTRFRRALMRLAAVWLMNVGVSRVVNDTPIKFRGRVNMQGLAVVQLELGPLVRLTQGASAEVRGDVG